MQGLSRAPRAGNEGKTAYRDYTPQQVEAMSEAEWSRVQSDPQTWAELQYAMKRHEGLQDYEDISYDGRR